MLRGVSVTSMSLSGEVLYLEIRFVLVSSNSREAIKALAHFTGSSCPSCPIWCQRVQMFSDREWCGCAWTRSSLWLNPTYLLLGIPLRGRGGSHAIDERIESKPPFPLLDGFCKLHLCLCQDSSSVLLFHAELDNTTSLNSEANPTAYETFLQSRPQTFESDAISLIVNLLKVYPSLRCHIVHLSAASALPIIREAKRAGLPLTVETCFHYLCLSAEDIPRGHTEFKCCPPVRESSNRDQLWDALKEGLIDCVVSDHSPCVVELKNMETGDFMSAWGGISTLGLGLSLLWTEGRKRGVPLGQLIEWISTRTAEHGGLGDTKGKLAVGYDGDFVLWDPEADLQVGLIWYK